MPPPIQSLIPSPFSCPTIPALSPEQRQHAESIKAVDGLTLAAYYDMLRGWVSGAPDAWQLGVRVSLPATYTLPRIAYWSDALAEYVLQRVWAVWSDSDTLLAVLTPLVAGMNHGWTESSLTKAIGLVLGAAAILSYGSHSPLPDATSSVPPAAQPSETAPLADAEVSSEGISVTPTPSPYRPPMRTPPRPRHSKLLPNAAATMKATTAKKES